MTKRIAAFALIAAAVAGPAFAMGEGGCNWGASFTSAQTEAPQTPIVQTETPDARG
ncbi:MAG: hypothetical protein AAF321_09255 [Pseudomonadota bacterium]